MSENISQLTKFSFQRLHANVSDAVRTPANGYQRKEKKKQPLEALHLPPSEVVFFDCWTKQAKNRLKRTNSALNAALCSAVTSIHSSLTHVALFSEEVESMKPEDNPVYKAATISKNLFCRKPADSYIYFVQLVCEFANFAFGNFF